VFEIPSGAWADTVDRRALLVLSAALYAGTFVAWTALPSYLGFAAGFALWGLSGALLSGTFEAWLYDELATRSATPAYAQLLGWAHSTAMPAMLAGTALGAPLYAWGGYPLVGWTSVAVVAAHAGLAATLPPGTRRPPPMTHRESPARRYAAMLRDGIGQAARHVPVRRLIALYAVMFGLSAYDEYFPILARDSGVATTEVPLLVGLLMLGQSAGTALAGRTAAMSGRAMAALLATSAVLVSAGALVLGPPGWAGWSGWSGLAGLAAIAVGYGAVHNAIIVAAARLQDLITSQARATVTSVAGLSTEMIVLAVYAAFAIGSAWLSIATIIALLGLPMLGVAAAARRRLPPI
jgi:MFS family permease